MEIIYFIHAKNVNVLCFGAKQMSDTNLVRIACLMFFIFWLGATLWSEK